MNGTTGQEQQIQTVCLLIVSVVAVAVGLYWLRSVMVPFVFAVLIAFGLVPLIDLLIRYLHLPRSIALLATLLASFVMLGVVGGLISSSVDKLAARADIYQEQLAQLLDSGMAALPLERFGVQVERTVESLSDISLTTVSSMLFTVTAELLGLVSSGLLVMIFVAFMLVGSTGLEMARDGFWGEVQSRIQRYIIVKGLVSALTGVLVGLTLVMLGVDLALVFGVFAFLLNFIPSLGSIVATLFASACCVGKPGPYSHRSGVGHSGSIGHPVHHRKHRGSEAHGQVAGLAPGHPASGLDSLGHVMGHRGYVPGNTHHGHS